MLFNEKALSTLMDLGFTSNQSRTYLALVVLGPSTVKTVHEFLGIPREEVYRKLDELIKLGFVKRTFSRPAVYEAIPLETTIQTLLNQKAEKMKKITALTEELLKEFEENHKRIHMRADEPITFLIPQQKAADEMAKKDLKNAEDSMDLVLSWDKGTVWMTKHFDHFMNCLNKNLKIRVILEKTLDNKIPTPLKSLQQSPNFKLKIVKALPPAVICLYDRKRVVIDTEARSSYTQSPCIWSNNPCIVGMVQIYFETLWNQMK